MNKKRRVVGQVTECRILPTKNAGPVAIAKVETEEWKVEEFLSPAVFRRYRELIVDLGPIEFYGVWQGDDESSSEPAILLADNLNRA